MPLRARSLAISPFGHEEHRLAELLPVPLMSAAREAHEAQVLLLEDPPDVSPALAILVSAGAFVHLGAAGLVVVTHRQPLERAARVPEANEVATALLRAYERAALPPRILVLRDRHLSLDGAAHVIGILNVTPDSFYDGGRYRGIEAARGRAAQMVEQGATLIDIGGQSYSAANPHVSESDEVARVLPVLQALVRDGLDVAFSIDTCRPMVAEAALDAGAHLINDCSGLAQPALADVVARYDAGLVVMHLKGELKVRATSYSYQDPVAEIVAFLDERIERAMAAGVRKDAIVADPGLEFGKDPRTDLEILHRFGDLRTLGFPLLLAASRKHFLARLYGRPSESLLAPSLAAAAIGISAGARFVRAHDVAETVDVARLLATHDRAREAEPMAALG